MKNLWIKVAALFAGILVAATTPHARAEVPEQIAEVFGERLVNAEGKQVSSADLAGKKIGLYFSAEWCPPCRAFTPLLVNAYNELRAEGKPFEVIFVSHDRTARAMRNYMRGYEMPWLAVPFDSALRDALKQKHNIRGIPTLVIVNDQGVVLSSNGRNEVTSRGAAAFNNW